MELTIGLCDPVTEPVTGLHPLPGFVLSRILRFTDNVLWRASIDGAGENATPSTPAEYLCLTATTPEGVASAHRLSGEIAEATGIDLPVADLSEVSKASRRKAVYELCVRVLTDRAKQSEQQVGKLAAGLSTLRREYEAVLQRFAEIEANVVMLEQQPIRTLCDQKAVEAFEELGETARLGRHAGIDLPFGTLGFYLLGLYLDAESAEGPLDISIVTRGTQRVLARWTHELHGEPAGWQTWIRKVALTEAYSAARLLLAFRGKGALRIGMGPHHPAKRVWLTGANGVAASRHIAIRALATTPGLLAPEASDSVHETKRVWDVGGAIQITPEPIEIPGLVTLSPEGGVLATPVIGEITSASLGAVLPRGATAIKATGIVAHPDGPLVDFALMTGDADTVRDMIRTYAIEQNEAFSGWVTGAAMCPVVVALALPRATTGQEELFLLTRISPESTHDWCAHAVFRNVQIVTERELENAG